jgi:hypothetical protein
LNLFDAYLLLLFVDAPTIPDLALMRAFLLKEGYLAKDTLRKLITDVTAVLSKLFLLTEHPAVANDLLITPFRS